MKENQFIDLSEAKGVEIRVRGDGKVVWVNVDGRCVFRCHNPEIVEVVDEREETPNPSVVAPEYQYLTEGGQRDPHNHHSDMAEHYCDVCNPNRR